MTFTVDSRIEASSVFLFDAPLSRLYLKNEAHFPWVVLVPRVAAIREIHQLSNENQRQLMNEISQVSQQVSAYFKADKINVGALGNIVQQLHIHVIARFTHDPLWPHSLWQSAAADWSMPYSEANLQRIKTALQNEMTILNW